MLSKPHYIRVFIKFYIVYIKRDIKYNIPPFLQTNKDNLVDYLLTIIKIKTEKLGYIILNLGMSESNP
jgi:hypothetical protein